MNVRSLAMLLASLLAAGALAGCADTADTGDDTTTPPADDTTTPPADDETTPPADDETTPPADDETPADTNETPADTNETGAYTLTTSGIPAVLTAGNEFTFELTVDGPAGTSDHLGAHIADNTTTTPGAGRLDCVHDVEATLPGTFHVTCTIPEGGVWYVYGHMQTLDGEERLNHWAEPVEVTVYDYNLTLEQTADSALGANFTLTIDGEPESTSTHAGAHFTTEPVTGAFSTKDMGACQHSNATAPSSFDFTCEFPAAGTYYVYGHYRVQQERDGTWIEDFWSSPVEVTVEAAA